MQILIRKTGRTEPERRKREAATQILRHYYSREIRDGSRIRLPAGVTKEMIRKVYR